MAVQTRRQEPIYTDVRGDFVENPATNDLLLASNETAVEQSIRNLLLTNYYERPFQKRLGSNISALLFELDTAQTQYLLREAIIETIENFEPRCILMDVLVIPAPDLNSYFVEITYGIQSREEPITFNVLLERVR